MTSWADAGPLIERKHIDLVSDFGRWMARHGARDDYSQAGASPLVAAMRAYLMREYGDELPASARSSAQPLLAPLWFCQREAREREVDARPGRRQ